MNVRMAREKDIPKLGDLLCQVDLVHHKGRPDIFKVGRKYNDAQLLQLLSDKERPILVATDEADEVLGYCFCILQQHVDDNVLTDIKTLYIDDLCVDSRLRGQGIGKELLRYAENAAATAGCDAVTLNVWSLNAGAMRFYEKCGYAPLKVVMERPVK